MADNLINYLRRISDTLIPEGQEITREELLRRIKDKMHEDKFIDEADEQYADASIMQTIGLLSKEPYAKVVRPANKYVWINRIESNVETITDAAKDEVANLGGTQKKKKKKKGNNDDDGGGGEEESGTRLDQIEEKFRAILYRHLLRDPSYCPLIIDHVHAKKKKAGYQQWMFPDLLTIDWTGVTGDIDRLGRVLLNKSKLRIKESLGEQAFKIRSYELKAGIHISNFRECFFQTLSNSKWAHAAYLVAAAPIDEQIQKELKRLSALYNINIITFNIDLDKLDQLTCNSDEILKFSEDEIDKLLVNELNIDPVVISSTNDREYLDWDTLDNTIEQFDENKERPIRQLYDWIQFCLERNCALSFNQYKDAKLNAL